MPDTTVVSTETSTPQTAPVADSVMINHAPEYDITALYEAGVHFGHQSRKWHPSMKEYIYMEKDGIHIFDLVQTASQLQAAYNFAYELGKNGKTLVFVGTKRQAREIIKTQAEACGAMSITSRWLGGLLTNWEQVFRSLKHMLEIEEGLANDRYKGYTKFERVQLEKELGRLQRFFGGIKKLKNRPDAIFVVDATREKNAVVESNTVGVPVMGVVDTNTDPRPLKIAIPGNDDAATSIEILVTAVADGYKAGREAKK